VKAMLPHAERHDAAMKLTETSSPITEAFAFIVGAFTFSVAEGVCLWVIAKAGDYHWWTLSPTVGIVFASGIQNPPRSPPPTPPGPSAALNLPWNVWYSRLGFPMRLAFERSPAGSSPTAPTRTAK